MTDWQQVKSIFAASLEVPASQRPAFLDAQCEGRPELRAEVESLLAAHEDAAGFLSEPALPRAAPRNTLAPGDRLGVYTIVQKIDEGGMAAVYQAVRDDAEFRK